jgi:hypothetical protein
VKDTGEITVSRTGQLLAVAATLALVFSALGGCLHKHCVSSRTVSQQVSYCCKQGKGYCESTCFRTQEAQQCTSWACDAGYVEQSGKCVKMTPAQIAQDPYRR